MKGWTLIKNVANEQEAAMVESILGAEGIPVQRKHKEAGSYLEIYMGTSIYGIDLFVPEDAASLAKELLNSEVVDMPEGTDIEEAAKTEEKYKVKRGSIVRVILIYLIFVIIVVIIWNIMIK